MAGSIKSVLISDDIDKCCPEILAKAGINVVQATKLSKEDLIAKLQVPSYFGLDRTLSK